MRNVTVQRDIQAPASAVWAVLADFPNIAEWNTGVKKSFSTSGEQVAGVGAQRHCDLAPLGGLEETVREWEEGRRLVVSIDEAAKVPLRRAEATFELADQGEVTPLTFAYRYEPKGGPFAALVGRVLDAQFRKGFEGFLRDLEAEAQRVGNQA